MSVCSNLDIALIGLSCRWAGADAVDESLRGTAKNVESLRGLSPVAFPHAVPPTSEGTSGADSAAGAPEIDQFDSEFFGLSPPEARDTDPAQCILLQLAHEALDHAGYGATGARARIGVYFGTDATFSPISTESRGDRADAVVRERLSGTQESMSAWVSSKLDLRGPSIFLQQSARPFLAALQLARRDLLRGAADLALVGALSARRQSTGYLHSGGVVVLKRLVDAASDDDSIHAVIGELPDPSELARNHGAQRSAVDSLDVGRGDNDAAEEFSGLVRNLLLLRQGRHPSDAGEGTFSSHVHSPGSSCRIEIPLKGWDRDDTGSAGSTCAAMSIPAVDRAAGAEHGSPTSSDTKSSQLLILSAKTESALDRASQSLRDFLAANESVCMRDVAYTLQRGRKEYAHKRALVCTDRDDAIAALTEGNPKRVLANRPNESRRPLVFLLPGVGDQYVGMAYDLYATWDLFRQEVDRCAEILLRHLDVDIRTILYPPGQSWRKVNRAKGIDLKQMLGRNSAEADPDTAKLNHTLFAQPALFTVEYAMARLLQRLGAQPDAIVGHSMGEYVAACLAGVFSLPDALRLIAVRAALVSELPQAAMLSVMLPESELRPLLQDDLFISLINGPSLCVVAGAPEAVARFEELLTEREVISRRVQNAHGFHSRMMDPIVETFKAEAAKVELHAPKIPYISNLTGGWVTAAEATDPSYWAKHLSHTARFSDALHQMWQMANPLMLECGPGHTLGVLALQHPDRKAAVGDGSIWTIRQRYQSEADDKVLLNAIAKLWLSGIAVEWADIQSHGRGRRIPLPTYPYETRRPWTRGSGGEPEANQQGAAEGKRESRVSGLPSSGPPVRAASPPISALETGLLQLWENVLETRGFGVEENFFNLGGTSLLSVKLLAEINRLFRMQLTLTAILDAPTVRSMALLISQSGVEERNGLVCLKRGGAANLFLVHDGFGETLLYLHLAVRLPANLSVYGIEPRRLPGIPLAHTSVEAMAAYYVEQIRALQPRGPYLLGGLCAGGVIAYAMATCLKASGEQVDLVTLFDSAMPQAVRRPRRAIGHRISRLEDAVKQASQSDGARRVRWISIAAVIARKVRNAAVYEVSDLCQRISVRLRFTLLKFLVRHNRRWPTAVPGLNVLQIYTVLRSYYTPAVLSDVPVLLVRASAGEGADMAYRDVYRDADLGWGGLAKRLELADARGGHSSMLQEHAIDSVVSVLLKRLSTILLSKDRCE